MTVYDTLSSQEAARGNALAAGTLAVPPVTEEEKGQPGANLFVWNLDPEWDDARFNEARRDCEVP